MEKILVTGLSGFVGRHFLEFIDKNEIPAEILGLDVSPNKAAGGLYKKLNCASASIDLLDAGATQSCLSQFQPSSILHLAASRAWLTVGKIPPPVSGTTSTLFSTYWRPFAS